MDTSVYYLLRPILLYNSCTPAKLVCFWLKCKFYADILIYYYYIDVYVVAAVGHADDFFLSGPRPSDRQFARKRVRKIGHAVPNPLFYTLTRIL